MQNIHNIDLHITQITSRSWSCM